jgi:hypothetical protein
MSSNQLTPYNANRPALAGDGFRAQPARYSPAGRAITRSDRSAVTRAHEIANDAAVADFKNELVHQLKVNEIQRRARRAHDVMHAAGALLSVAETLAHGDQAKQLEYLDVYNAWKQGEIYRIVTE